MCKWINGETESEKKEEDIGEERIIKYKSIRIKKIIILDKSIYVGYPNDKGVDIYESNY